VESAGARLKETSFPSWSALVLVEWTGKRWVRTKTYLNVDAGTGASSTPIKEIRGRRRKFMVQTQTLKSASSDLGLG
jgi:hypothetical protein